MPKAKEVRGWHLCPGCNQPMLPAGEIKKPNEYDHAQGCPLDPKAIGPLLDPLEASLYPNQSGNELEQIINHAHAQTERFLNYSSVRSVRYEELADCYATIMRLAAYIRTLEGKI